MRLRRLQRRARLFAVLAAPAACSVVDPTFAEPALIIFYGDTAQVATPSSVTRGVPFEVSVQTFGGGCTRMIARTETDVSGAVAEIRPYNETRRSDVCTDDLLFLTHVVSIQFDHVGPVTIRVIAEQRPFGDTTTRTGPAALEYQLVVQ
jgi:hypothetical protein